MSRYVLLSMRNRSTLMASSYHTYRPRLTCPSHAKIADVRARPLHKTAYYYRPHKDSQDKDSLKPRSTEYSQSGGDDAAASAEQAAFDPDQTSPEEQMGEANKESGEVKKRSGNSNPLNASPANKEISEGSEKENSTRGSSPQESGQSGERQGASGAGSAPKAGGQKSG